MWWMVLWSTRPNTAGCRVKATGAAQKWLGEWWRCPVKAAGVLSREGHWRPWWFLLRGWYWEPWPSNLFLDVALYLGHIGLPSDLAGNEAEVSHVWTVLKAWGSWLFSMFYLFSVRGICMRGSHPCAGHCQSEGRDNVGKMTLMLLSNFWEVNLNISFIVL